MKRFAIIGAAGFVAERHIRAIKETGNELVCTMDIFDVMGRMDNYFPEAEFFTSEDELIMFLQLCKSEDNPIDFISICSPNYLHIKHIELALKNGCNAICEKPLVIQASDLDTIQMLEKETGKRVFTVLQLRYHPEIIQLKQEIEKSEKVFFQVELEYITTRKCWKGDPHKSGGIAANIGIHFFDMLTWIFGGVKYNMYEDLGAKMTGTLLLERAEVNWFLSLDVNDLPTEAINAGKSTFRSIKIDGNELEFSDGFDDLHTETYRQILAGNGFGVDEAKESILLTNFINKQ